MATAPRRHKYWFAIEPGAAFLESEDNLWPVADYAITYGVDETVELFAEWLREQISDQRRIDDEAQAKREREKTLEILRETAATQGVVSLTTYRAAIRKHADG